jgi:hypothetical protein
VHILKNLAIKYLVTVVDKGLANYGRGYGKVPKRASRRNPIQRDRTETKWISE